MEATVFHNLCSEVSYYHFYFILLATQTNPSAVWKGTTQGYEYQQARLTGAVSEAAGHRSPMRSSGDGHFKCTSVKLASWTFCLTPRWQTPGGWLLNLVHLPLPF